MNKYDVEISSAEGIIQYASPYALQPRDEYIGYDHTFRQRRTYTPHEHVIGIQTPVFHKPFPARAQNICAPYLIKHSSTTMQFSPYPPPPPPWQAHAIL